MKPKTSLHGSLFVGFLILTVLVLSGCGGTNNDTSSQTADLSKGLIVYFSFTGNANDESGNGHNGTVNGATLCDDHKGNSQSAYSFDGVDDWISTNFSNVLSDDKFTVACWVRLPETPFTDQGRIITCGKFDFIPYRYNTTDFVGLQITNYGGYAKEAFITVGSGWVHFVGTYDGSNICVYKNGIHAYTVNHQGPLLNKEPLNLSIAHSQQAGNDGTYFKGALDSIRIYNRVLTETEISSLYDNDK